MKSRLLKLLLAASLALLPISLPVEQANAAMVDQRQVLGAQHHLTWPRRCLVQSRQHLVEFAGAHRRQAGRPRAQPPPGADQVAADADRVGFGVGFEGGPGGLAGVSHGR